MKKLTLLLIRLFANDRDFRINVSKELHRNAQNYFGDQTVYGRYYEACGEFFEGNPLMTLKNTEKGIINEFNKTKQRLIEKQ